MSCENSQAYTPKTNPYTSKASSNYSQKVNPFSQKVSPVSSVPVPLSAPCYDYTIHTFQNDDFFSLQNGDLLIFN